MKWPEPVHAGDTYILIDYLSPGSIVYGTAFKVSENGRHAAGGWALSLDDGEIVLFEELDEHLAHGHVTGVTLYARWHQLIEAQQVFLEAQRRARSVRPR